MTQRIEFEGAVHEFPDDFTDADIAAALGGGSDTAPAPPTAYWQPEARPKGKNALRTPVTTTPKTWSDVGRKLTLAGQDAVKTVSSVAGLPFDMTNIAGNVVLSGVDKAAELFGGNVDYRLPVGAGQSIEKGVLNTASAVGVPLISDEERTPTERLIGDINNFAGQGLLGGLGLAKLAAREAPNLIPAGESLWNAFTRSYRGNPTGAVISDTAAGAGSGVGHNVAENSPVGDLVSSFIGKPMTDFLLTLGGGIAGGTAANAGRTARDTAVSAVNNRRADYDLPINPTTGERFSKADAEAVARHLQEGASDPTAAATAIKTNANEIRSAGVSEGAMPTSGLLSEDTRLVNTEQRARRTPEMAPEFIDRDDAVKNAAAEKIGSVRNPDVDQMEVKAGVKRRKDALVDERDAEAIPLLRSAEASGAVVDAAPVAALIDEKLATAKRPPVRAALTEARKMLNRAGGEELDTSVSGLYEARKAVNDIIEGRGENPTGKFAQKELIEVRAALDDAITKASPEFGEYLQKYREGSAPLDDFGPATPAKTLGKEDPRDVAEGLLGGKWGADRKIDEINRIIGSDAAARDGWKAAVADVLYRRVSTTNTAAGQGENFAISYAKLTNLFRDNRVVLSKVFGPEEMNDLQQGHKLLSYFKNAEKRAVTGSDTLPKFLDSLAGKAVQLALRHHYGDLKGGGIIRRMRVMASLMPSNKQNLDELAKLAWFNPDVAAHLLGKKVRDFRYAPANINLRRLIAGEAGLNTAGQAGADDEPGPEPTDGRILRGNIDLAKRPRVKNDDGSVSTVRSMSFEQDGKEILVPTVSDDGKILSDDEAIALYRRTGKHLGVFKTPDAATAYAEWLHRQQEKAYRPAAREGKDASRMPVDPNFRNTAF